jgi:hypothetical protein
MILSNLSTDKSDQDFFAKKPSNCEKEKAGDRQQGTSQESLQFTQQLLQCTTVEQDNRAGVGLIWMS